MSIMNLQINEEAQTSVPASTSVVVLVAANPDRRHLTIFNNSTNKLYIDIDNDPALDDAMLVLQPAQTYFSETLNNGGEVRGIWDGTDGQANIREYE